MKFLYCTLIYIFFTAGSLSAQSMVADSLKNALQKADKKDRPVLMAELARSVFEKDINAAIKQGQAALTIAKKNKHQGAMAFCYATMAHLYVQKHQENRATVYIDSAIKAAEEAKEPALASFAWFRKGWLEMVKGNDENAMAGFLKAEQLIRDETDRRSASHKTLINHYIASIYSYGNDTLKQHKYAAACLKYALQSRLADDIQIGYMTLAHSFFSSFEKNTSKKLLLDSSLFHFRKAMRFYERNKKKILLQSNGSVVALNIANIYFKYYPTSHKDSVDKYVETALGIARKSNGSEIIANCYGILSEYAMRQQDYQAAENYLQTGIAELAGASAGVGLTRSRLMLGLANVAERSGDEKKALQYYKQYTSYYQKAFDAQKLATTQQLEEEYQSSLREKEIVLLKERGDYNKRLNWLYALAGSAGIIVLGLLLSSYHYKLKASMQQHQISNQKKEEAELLARLQQSEAQQLALEKQEAELQASLKTEESARLLAQQELLHDRTEWLEKELLAGTLKIEEKNAILSLLKEQTKKTDSPVAAKQIGNIINQHLRLDKSVDEHQAFEQIQPGFFSALQERAAGSLTRLDLKYCAYILMRLDNKEIANRLSVAPKSIRMARYRLKQKLLLEKEDQLDQFIFSFQKP